MDAKQDFTSGSIFGKMMQFMIPILGAQILQAMYGAVDMLVVGHFGTNAGISGVSTGSSIMNLVTFVLSQLAAGVMILIGRYLGERQNERIGRLIGRAVAFFLVVSAVLTVALIGFAEQIAVLMQAPAEAVELTAQYIRICGMGCVFIVFYNLISCIFRGLGNSRLPLLFVGIACVVNIVGDLVLVAVLDMNVAGAAIATIGAQAVSVILSLLIIRRQKLPFSFSLRDIRLDREVGGFVRVGAPLALQELLTNITFLAICAFINRLGLDASNGYGIAQKIQSFVMLVPSSIMQCMASFVAQNVGANKEERAQGHALRHGRGRGHRRGDRRAGAVQRRCAGLAVFGKRAGHRARFRIPARLCARGGAHQRAVQLFGLFQRPFPLHVRHGAEHCAGVSDPPAGLLLHEHSAGRIADGRRAGGSALDGVRHCDVPCILPPHETKSAAFGGGAGTGRTLHAGL